MSTAQKPSESEAMAAVKTLIAWTGDDPERDSLLETPLRVIKAFREFFVGYTQDPKEILKKTFTELANYDEMIVLKKLRLESYCEHHMVPIIGMAHVAYIPDRRVVGISKLARIVDVYARRLQTQENMTTQIAESIQSVLQPKGVAVVIDAIHQCMTTRGVRKAESSTVTSQMLGIFRKDPRTRAEFMQLIQ